jgi:hypothetical protein
MPTYACLERQLCRCGLWKAVHHVFLGGQKQQPRGACGTATPIIDFWIELTIRTQSPFTHGFVVEFSSEQDRDYYVNKDPAHQDFIKFAGELLQSVKVLDYESGKL